MSDGRYGLPPGWTVVRVDEAGEVQLGRQRSPEHHHGPNMRPYLRVANVFEDRIDTSDVMSMNFEPDEYERFVLEPGDILLNEGQTKELVGRSAIYNGETPGACFTNSLVRFRAGEATIPGYAQALFKHYVRSGYFQTIAKITTNIAHLGKQRFAALDYLLPPLDEQKRIVAKIEALQARSEAAKEALDAIPPLLEKFRQSVLASAFRGDLTKAWREQHPDVEPASKLLERIRVERRRRWEEANPRKKYKEPEPADAGRQGLPELPERWCWASLDELLVSITSGSRGWADYYSDDGPLFIRAQDINTDSLVLDCVAHVNPPRATEGTRTLVAPKDLLVTITGANVTKAAVVPDGLGEGYVSQHVALCRPVLAETARLLHLWLTSEVNGRKQLLSAAYGGGKPGLNLDNIRDVVVALPPAAEQVAVVERVEEMLNQSDGLTEATRLATEVHGTLHQSILAKAFRGELVPQDPSDEPAEVLLERIRAEREGNGVSRGREAKVAWERPVETQASAD